MCLRLLLLGLTILATHTRQVASERAVFGRWRVTASICPTQCAISRAQAAAWRGRFALYSDSLVRIGAASCRSPRYNVGYWPATGIYGGARLKDFGIHADSALVVEVRCPSQPHSGSDPRWPVWGGFLIVKNSEHVLVVWEAVFFELTR